MNHSRLLASLERYADCSLLCVGDVMLDHFVYGDVGRISPEAPIPVVSVEREESMLGGAGNVVRNLTSLGARVIFVTLTGDDPAADEIERLLRALPNCQPHIVRDPTRRTSVKTRYLAHNQQLLRVDSETLRPVAPSQFTTLLEHFTRNVPKADLAILSDYAKGVLSGQLACEFITAGRDAGKPVYVDPKGHDFRRYQGATLIKPNLKELAEATKLPVNSPSEIESAARQLIADAGCSAILVTRGAGGMMLIRDGREATSFRARAREVYDVSGAGDTVAATLALGTAAGLDLDEAVELACVASGLVVAKVGTATLTQRELLHELESDGLPSDGKLLGQDQAVHRAAMWRKGGYRVGYAWGRFETIGAPEVTVLRAAKGQCDKLIVGMHDSEGVAGRAVLLSALACVDLVAIADGGLVSRLGPDSMTEIGKE